MAGPLFHSTYYKPVEKYSKCDVINICRVGRYILNIIIISREIIELFRVVINSYVARYIEDRIIISQQRKYYIIHVTVNNK